MAASVNTRFHESGHALVAYRLGMLHGMGMILNSDLDSYVCVVEENDGTRCWAVRRIAIKLAGPLGRILQQGEELEWDTMRLKGEYARDFEEAKEIAMGTLAVNPLTGQSDEANILMNEACNLAMQYLSHASGHSNKTHRGNSECRCLLGIANRGCDSGDEQRCSTGV